MVTTGGFYEEVFYSFYKAFSKKKTYILLPNKHLNVHSNSASNSMDFKWESSQIFRVMYISA